METPAELPYWVPALIIVEPDLSVPLARAGIRDDLPVAEMGLPEMVLSRLSAVGVVTVGDLAKTVHVPTGLFEERAIRLALYLAGRRGAPARAAAPPSKGDRVRSAVRSAPLPLRERLLAEIPGVPNRALNAMRSGGVRLVGDLESCSDRDLRMLNSFGEKSLENLLMALRSAIAFAEREPGPVT